MRLVATFLTLFSTLMISACIHKGANPADPYEPINRKIHKFNVAFDATMLKPPARLYKTVVPAPVRASINNAYNNIQMLPTIANDLLQTEWHYAIKDSWRFMINSTFGIAGLFDVAASNFSLPPHYNDLGLTFAKWGDKKSPYIVIPLLGPSTIRDGMGMLFDYTLFTPYPYIPNSTVIYSLIGLRYVDLRSQLFDVERLIDEALDKYTFVRDAYLQHRHYLITGEEQNTAFLFTGEEKLGEDYIDDEPGSSNKSPYLETTKSS